jgi:hypothetical protein
VLGSRERKIEDMKAALPLYVQFRGLLVGSSPRAGVLVPDPGLPPAAKRAALGFPMPTRRVIGWLAGVRRGGAALAAASAAA